MREIFLSNREIMITKERKRIKETRIYGVQDDDGNFRLLKVFVRIYTELNTSGNEDMCKYIA